MAIKCPKCHFENLDDSHYCAKCTTPLVPSEEIPIQHTKTLQIPMLELAVGSILAQRYKILEELGKGGMGKIYEEKGWTGKAIESYEKFLDLWKNADPGLPEVPDAKKRLATLKK